jgi:catechol 2,3-dioxygenase-like lactoylglutathione lyase family enzyme
VLLSVSAGDATGGAGLTLIVACAGALVIRRDHERACGKPLAPRARDTRGGVRSSTAMALNHVALTVSDRSRAAAFYAEHFGLTERIHEDEELLILSADDGSVLALSGESVAARLPRTNHFGFRLADGDAVRSARERFRAAGAVELEWQDDGTFVRVQVADPDGYRVEFYAF